MLIRTGIAQCAPPPHQRVKSDAVSTCLLGDAYDFVDDDGKPYYSASDATGHHATTRASSMGPAHRGGGRRHSSRQSRRIAISRPNVAQAAVERALQGWE
jgi:hypothetical protein